MFRTIHFANRITIIDDDGCLLLIRRVKVDPKDLIFSPEMWSIKDQKRLQGRWWSSLLKTTRIIIINDLMYSFDKIRNTFFNSTYKLDWSKQVLMDDRTLIELIKIIRIGNASKRTGKFAMTWCSFFCNNN